ncbi:MAG: type IIL restriction-modification enzyme MmeI, partial [Beijerinckiaceae bacterium]
KAHVHCVIIGLTLREDEPKEKRLFSYEKIDSEPKESGHAALSPYLFDAGSVQNRHLVVEEANQPLLDVKRVIIGSKPIDGGHFIFSESEAAEFLIAEPDAAPFMRPYIGSQEYLNGNPRQILALQSASPAQLKSMPKVMECIAAVRDYRLGKRLAKRKEGKELKSPGMSSLALAATPTLFHVNVIPELPFLVIPEVSSERRAYVPIGWLEPPTIPSNLVRIIENATLFDFALITSRMHMAWLRNVGGRLESRYRYSIGIVYNTFPWPEANDKAKDKLRSLAQAVLDARAAHPDSTLADLYDPDVMPPDLRRAHKALDEAVDRLYRAAAFASDRERVEHLFMLYEKLTADLLTGTKVTKKPRRTKKTLG